MAFTGEHTERHGLTNMASMPIGRGPLVTPYRDPQPPRKQTVQPQTFRVLKRFPWRDGQAKRVIEPGNPDSYGVTIINGIETVTWTDAQCIKNALSLNAVEPVQAPLLEVSAADLPTPVVEIMGESLAPVAPEAAPSPEPPAPPIRKRKRAGRKPIRKPAPRQSK